MSPARPERELTTPSPVPLHPSIRDKLDPAFVKLYDEHLAYLPALTVDLNTTRSQYASRYSYATAPATGVGGIGETQVPGWDKYPGDVNLRVYVPPGEEPGRRKEWPVHFNFHGGGWIAGDLDTDAHMCHHICAMVPCCVIDVDYRLVPEYPFPTSIMDALCALRHILANHHTFSIDPNNITLGGVSSGGTVALVLSYLLRDAAEKARLKGVVVGTPYVCDLRKHSTPSESPWPSMQRGEQTPLLDWSTLKWFDSFKWASLTRMETPEQELLHDVSWYANLLEAPNVPDLAPLTWIGTAEFDPLHDEAVAYAEKLQENGNQVITHRFMGVPHPFVYMDRILPQAQEYVHEVVTQIRSCLHPSTRSGTPKSSTNGTSEVGPE